MSKHLLLCNLKELYSAYISHYPQNKTGFSKFASFCSKWYILAGPKGTHSVCVCTVHQDLKLMLSAIGLDSKYHDLIEMIVCNRDARVCMVHRCEKCPGIGAVEQYLKNQIQQIDGGASEDLVDMDNDFEIDFKQWMATDCTELISQKLPVDEFINLLCEKLDKITAHSFMAQVQSQYLKQLKDNLKPNEAVELLDFVENYQFQV